MALPTPVEECLLTEFRDLGFKIATNARSRGRLRDIAFPGRTDPLHGADVCAANADFRQGPGMLPLGLGESAIPGLDSGHCSLLLGTFRP